MGDMCKQKVASPMMMGGSAGGKHKERKPYTITKQRENWTEEEHVKFLEALKIYERDWKKIEGFIGTKSVIQIRSHAQKYFLKVQKNRTGEHVPPPRPKRRSTQPYPQKPKSLGSPETPVTSSISSQSDTFNYPALIDSRMSDEDSLQQEQLENEEISKAQILLKEYLASVTTSRAPSPSSDSCESLGPDFPKIYQFLGSLFDPEMTSHTEHVDRLNSMTALDRETVHVLMHNMSMNLGNDRFRGMAELQLIGKFSKDTFSPHIPVSPSTPPENGTSNPVSPQSQGSGTGSFISPRSPEPDSPSLEIDMCSATESLSHDDQLVGHIDSDSFLPTPHSPSAHDSFAFSHHMLGSSHPMGTCPLDLIIGVTAMIDQDDETLDTTPRTQSPLGFPPNDDTFQIMPEHEELALGCIRSSFAPPKDSDPILEEENHHFIPLGRLSPEPTVLSVPVRVSKGRDRLPSIDEHFTSPFVSSYDRDREDLDWLT
mmetsp:Transcript_45407/g.75775  ORF Transcript_45407/g.75775 Transcript_45407/m.75775 type:complete len:485 (+) Transcript_45407:80-1534(+)